MRLLPITPRAPLGHVPSSGIKRTWDESGPSLLSQKLKMANGRKTLPCAAWDVPTWFCWVLCVFQELKQSIGHCNKTGYYECSTRNTKRYITKGKFYRDYFFLLFCCLYIISITTLTIIENRALWLASSFALSRYNHRAVIITLQASSFRNGSQIFWCFGVGNWSIILFSRIIINVIILKIVKSKLIYQLISMTIAEVSYSKHTSQKPFCFQWTSLTRAKVIPGGVGAGAGWRPCDARRKIWIKLRKEAILTVTHT